MLQYHQRIHTHRLDILKTLLYILINALWEVRLVKMSVVAQVVRRGFSHQSLNSQQTFCHHIRSCRPARRTKLIFKECQVFCGVDDTNQNLVIRSNKEKM